MVEIRPVTKVHQNVSISSREASALLGVHDSSIKRWCNAGELPFSLTPGGHRRIPIEQLVDFAKDRGIASPLVQFGEQAPEVWEAAKAARRGQPTDGAVRLVQEWIADGKGDLVSGLLYYLADEGVPLGAILDRIVGVVMRNVGVAYIEGELTIGEEHRMTQAMRDILIAVSASGGLTPNGKRAHPHGSVAVVGCLRDEVHELGALMVRLALQSTGWRVVYLGLDVPTEEFAAQQVAARASLVCVSVMPPAGISEAQGLVRLLDQLYDAERPYRLVVGGRMFNEDTELGRPSPSIPEVRQFSRLEPFLEWTQSIIQ